MTSLLLPAVLLAPLCLIYVIFHHFAYFTAQPAVSTAGTHSNIDYKTDVKKEQDETQYVQDLGKFYFNTVFFWFQV